MGEDVRQRQRAALTDAMNRYADGDSGAFATVYDLVAPRLRAYLGRSTGSAARADDLLQQTFLQLHAARHTWAHDADVLPWAYAIARRLVIDAQRRSVREALRPEPVPPGAAAADGAPDDIAAANELATLAQVELAQLPQSHREAWQLVRAEGLSVAQAAAVLGTTPMAVRLRTFRASEALRQRLGLTAEEPA